MSKDLWFGWLKYDPVTPLLNCESPAVSALASNHLLKIPVLTANLVALPMASRLFSSQLKDGSWKYPGANLKNRSRENFNQLETYRNLAILVEEFGLDRTNDGVRKAAKYLFSFQTKVGDFKGIYGRQYTPNYSAAIAELLIKAGYSEDRRIIKVLRWLLSVRQSDGGWAIPFRTRGRKVGVIYTRTETIEPDLSKPFSAMVTGVVLRAFAVHPKYNHAAEVMGAGKLLLSALFARDHYPDRAGKESWLRFNFPFWYTDLVSALDSLSLLRFVATQSLHKRLYDAIEAKEPEKARKLAQQIITH